MQLKWERDAENNPAARQSAARPDALSAKMRSRSVGQCGAVYVPYCFTRSLRCIGKRGDVPRHLVHSKTENA
jgi:hypothetical protein